MHTTHIFLHSEFDEFCKVIRGNVSNVGGLGFAGGAWVPRRNKDLFDRRRLCELPGESVLPSAAADEEDTDGHDKMKKAELPNRDRQSDRSTAILRLVGFGCHNITPGAIFHLLVVHCNYMRFLYDVG